jgi:hypothetical protein
LLFILFFCSSCGGWGITIPTKTPIIRSAWVEKWLYDPTCESPCWEDIIPNKTTEDDAVVILYQLPGVVISSNDTFQKQHNRIDWTINNDEGGGYLYIDSHSRIITDIFLDLRNNHLEIQEVIARYGQPTHIVVEDCIHGCSIYIVFVNKGIALLMYSIPYKHKDSKFSFPIKPEQEVSRIRLINTNVLSTRISQKEIWIFTWNGYGEYTGDW